MILAQKLEEEWNRIDTNRDGVVDEGELKNLLAHCSRMKPDDKVVREIFMRMAGSDAKVVTRIEFVNYLSSLRGDIACDRLITDERNKVTKTSAANADDVESARVPECSSVAALHRTVPGHFLQLQIIFRRRLIQWWRRNKQRALFLVALSVGAVVLAVMDRFILATPLWDAASFVNTQTALALLIAIFCLQVFGSDRPVFWREGASGISVQAFFAARVWVNTFDLVLLTCVFTSLYYVVRQPYVPFVSYLFPFLLVAYAASGWGYLLSTTLPPQHGPFITSLIIFVVCGLMGTPMNLQKFLDGGALEVGTSILSVTRWSVAMSFSFVSDCIQPNPTEMQEQYLFEMETSVYKRGAWTVGMWWTATFVLLLMGSALRLLALAGLLLINRDKRV